jgi:hypothetical protein
MLKDTNEILPNILEVMEEKENHYDSALYRKRNGNKRYFLTSLIKLSERKDVILGKIQNLCTREWGKYMEEGLNGTDFN